MFLYNLLTRSVIKIDTSDVEFLRMCEKKAKPEKGHPKGKKNYKISLDFQSILT